MRRLAVACAVVLLGTFRASACDYHIENFGVEIYDTPQLAEQTLATSADFILSSTSDPQISSWRQNLTGAVGTSTNSAMNAYVSQIPADVQQVAYTSNYVYVRASGIPTHNVGPFNDGNPAYPSNRNRVFRIPLVPTPLTQPTDTHTATGLGAIGVMVNGVPFYNSLDARSYNNQNVWHQNANVVEAAGFDTGPGHPSPIMNTSNPVQGAYHYHQSPTELINQIDPGNTGQHHSPILGFAFDGLPVYGPYGYTNSDGTGGIKRIVSSYRTRNITTRTQINGSNVTPGPVVSTQYPLGYYVEDYEYISGLGDLNEFNARFSVTPEYPQGTWAYFTTLTTGGAVYPYIIGPSYMGVLDTGNTTGTLSIPADAVTFVAPEPASLLWMAPLIVCSIRRRKSH